MTVKSAISTASLSVLLLLVLAGCQSKSARDSHDDHDHSEVTRADQSDRNKMMEQLASFSEQDRESVREQQFCPVSGERLGSMGAPEKVDVNGQTVWICCDGCKDKLRAEPEKYLEKLAASGAAAPDAE